MRHRAWGTAAPHPRWWKTALQAAVMIFGVLFGLFLMIWMAYY